MSRFCVRDRWMLLAASGSLKFGKSLAGRFFHASHNLVFLHFFGPIVSVAPAPWLTGEQGLLLCAVLIALAAVAFKAGAQTKVFDPAHLLRETTRSRFALFSAKVGSP